MVGLLGWGLQLHLRFLAASDANVDPDLVADLEQAESEEAEVGLWGSWYSCMGGGGGLMHAPSGFSLPGPQGQRGSSPLYLGSCTAVCQPGLAGTQALHDLRLPAVWA